MVLNIKIIILLVAVLFLTNNVHAGLFDVLKKYDTWEECYEKNVPKLRLGDAGNVLSNACLIGYGKLEIDHPIYKSIKASRCIVNGVNNFYSFDSTLAVINKCTKNQPDVFMFYRNALYRKENERLADSRKEAEEREGRIRSEINKSRQSNDGPFTILDASSGRVINCYRIGSMVTCD